MVFMLDGRRLFPDTPFWHGGVAYPANWLPLSTKADRDAIGIVEVQEQPRPDDRYYIVTDHGDGTYSSTPRDLNGLKLSQIDEAKATANTLLAPSDWYVTRRVEMGTAIPDAVANYRTAVRSSCEAIEQAINDATSIEDLQAIQWTWPHPHAPAPVPLKGPAA